MESTECDGKGNEHGSRCSVTGKASKRSRYRERGKEEVYRAMFLYQHMGYIFYLMRCVPRFCGRFLLIEMKVILWNNKPEIKGKYNR